MAVQVRRHFCLPPSHALEKQDLPCRYLAHHELEIVKLVIIVITFFTSVMAYANREARQS